MRVGFYNLNSCPLKYIKVLYDFNYFNSDIRFYDRKFCDPVILPIAENKDIFV